MCNRTPAQTDNSTRTLDRAMQPLRAETTQPVFNFVCIKHNINNATHTFLSKPLHFALIHGTLHKHYSRLHKNGAKFFTNAFSGCRSLIRLSPFTSVLVICGWCPWISAFNLMCFLFRFCASCRFCPSTWRKSHLNKCMQNNLSFIFIYTV